MHLHETEKPVMLEGAVVPVGYVVETKNFSFTAIYENDGSVNAYVEWGDDQGGDMSNHHSMAEAKRYLETLMKASEPEVPVVNVDMRKAVTESVDEGLKKAGIEDTNEARVSILMGMHGTLSKESPMTAGTKLVLRVIEDLIIELELG